MVMLHHCYNDMISILTQLIKLFLSSRTYSKCELIFELDSFIHAIITHRSYIIFVVYIYAVDVRVLLGIEHSM